MKKFDIIPLISVGEIKFGMERDKVREILGTFKEYKNRKEDNNTADCFELCQVFYDDNNCAEFIMFHNLDNVELVYKNNVLSKMEKSDIILFFSNLDENLLVEDYGQGIISIESNVYGIACYFVKDIILENDGTEKEIDKIETISVAVKNYWL